MTNRLWSRVSGLVVIGVLPVSAVFAANPEWTFIDSGIGTVRSLVNAAIPIIITLALLFFIWGLAQFILASGDEAAKDEGKRKMIWGVVALFFIVAVWGLVALLNEITGVNQDATYGTKVTIPGEAAPLPAA
jgi:hypothetical protein